MYARRCGVEHSILGYNNNNNNNNTQICTPSVQYASVQYIRAIYRSHIFLARHVFRISMELNNFPKVYHTVFLFFFFLISGFSLTSLTSSFRLKLDKTSVETRVVWTSVSSMLACKCWHVSM